VHADGAQRQRLSDDNAAQAVSSCRGAVLATA
jgi:hypothetical protein